MRRDKKIISIILSIVIIITSCSVAFFAKAYKKEVNINIELLDSILNDRYWIIETLVSGDISNNPYAVINTASTGENIMDEVLENYQNDEAFKTLVDAMEIYSNTGQYISGVADSIIETITGWFGDSDAVDKAVASTDELKYESILNEVLKTDYSSSWGDTLFEENMDMECLKQRSEILKKLDKYQTTLKDIVGLSFSDSSSVVIYDPFNSVDDTYEMDIEDYVGHFLDAYEQDLENYLMGIIEIPAIEGNEALKKKILSTGALGLVSAYERTVIPACDYSLDDVYYDGMFEDTMKIINGAGSVLSFADKSMDMAILLEALQSQRNTTVNTMSRICKNTKDEDLEKVLDNYADLLNSAGDKGALAYESITNYLRNEQTVTNIVIKKVKEKAPVLIKKAANKYAGATTITLSNALAKSIALVDLSLWVADQVTGIKDTAKKIYICKYLNKIIDEAIEVFLMDKKAYQAEKTDENAEKVLSDLQFLKELRLYGEKTAYGSMCSQMDSWLGIMLGGGDTKEYLDRRYQASIDTYLGCTFNPVTNNEFSLSKGDVLFISSEDVNGKTYSYARLQKATGELSYFAEADLRLMGGIDLNGATVNILSAPNGIYLPIVDNDEKDSEINIYCDNVAFGTINNMSSMTIEIHKEDKTFEITDSINNSGILNIKNSLYSSKIPVYEVSNTNQINIENCVLQCKGTPTNNGTITGMVEICGGEESYKNAYFTMGNQSMLGNGQYSDLYFTNNAKQGIKINGKQYVTNYISDGSTRLRTSQNLVLTANCKANNNYINNSVSFENYSSLTPLEVNGTGYIFNNVTFGETTTFNDGLNVTSSCKTLTLNGETNVYGDMNYGGGTIAGSDWLKLHGDLKISASYPSIANLCFAGVFPQNFSSSSELTVSKISIQNNSLNGINLSNVIKITDYISDGSTRIRNSKNLILTGNCIAQNNYINNSVSFKDYNASTPLEVNGTGYIFNNVTFGETTTFNDGLNVTSSCKTLTLNGETNVYGDMNYDGGTIAGSDWLKLHGDLKISASYPSIANLDFVGIIPQNFSSSNELTVSKLNNHNTSFNGVNFSNVIKVTDTLLSGSTTTYKNAKNVVLTGTAKVNDNTIKGTISAKDWTCVDSTNIKGSLFASGSINIPNSSHLTVSNDFYQSGTTNNNGIISIDGDGNITGVFNGGTLNVKGDLTASNSLAPDNLNFDSNVSQVFSNSSSTTVKKLTINNSSNDGFKVGSVITVTEYFDNQCENLIKGENIVLTNKSGYFTNGETKGNFTIAGDFTVSSGENLVVNGMLNLKSGANIIIEDGGSLTVKKYVNSSSAVINIDEGGLMQIDDYLNSSSDTFNIDGDMIVKGDAKITSSTFNSNGLITFKGDLNVSSATWNNPNIAFAGKLPQVVSGSTINVNNLIVDNNSKTGIDFKSVVNYYGEYDGNNSNIKNEDKLVKKS